MKKIKVPDLKELIEISISLSNASIYEGFLIDDKNIPDHKLVVTSHETLYSFFNEDIVRKEELGADRVRVWVRNDTKAYRISSFITGATASGYSLEEPPLIDEMENIAPPQPEEIPDSPQEASMAGIEDSKFEAVPSPETTPPPLSSVGANFVRSCVGGDSYANNCAHYLANAFIRAGYTDLYNANPSINARCPRRRPVRAREMWSWFQSKATRTSRTLTRNTGWWAVFQLTESAYWGGHVALLDSNNWLYYGTGWYPNWNQYLYQW